MLGQLAEDDHDPFDASLRRARRRRPSVAWLRDWVAWFGTGRLIATVVAIVGVAGAGWWLRPVARRAERSVAADGNVAPAHAVPHLPRHRRRLPATSPCTSPARCAVRASTRCRRAVGCRCHRPRPGGTRADADADALNLAAALADGSRVYVPAPGEIVPAEHCAPIRRPGVPAARRPRSRRPGRHQRGRRRRARDAARASGRRRRRRSSSTARRNGPFATVDDLEAVPRHRAGQARRGPPTGAAVTCAAARRQSSVLPNTRPAVAERAHDADDTSAASPRVLAPEVAPRRHRRAGRPPRAHEPDAATTTARLPATPSG